MLRRSFRARYTTSIFGINGNVNIRGVASDTYFRGVKRLENTQLFPSPITAMSRLDVVRGPPSPLYGPGKVGGYTNFVPKSARARTGKYLERPTGKAVCHARQLRQESRLGGSGRSGDLFGKRGGYYVYANLEDSETFYENVPFKQRILQSSFDYEISEALHLEFGQMYQYWGGTELAGWNRLTQELIDTGMYNAGTVSMNMDTNGDGLISTAEVDSFGPLLRTFAPGTPAATVAAPWARLADRPFDGPQSENPSQRQLAESRRRWRGADQSRLHGSGLHAARWLEAHEQALRRAHGPLQMDARFRLRAGHDVRRLRRKADVGEGVRAHPSGFQLNFGVSGLFRYYDTKNLSGTKYSDLVNRADLSVGFIQNNRFAVPNLENDLAPWNTGLSSRYTTKGLGSLIDATFRKANVVLGTRL